MRSTSVWDVPARDNLRTAVMDVTSEDSINSVVQNIIETDGKIDIVVNNAGYGVVGTVESVKLSEAKDVFDVNFWGVVRVLQAVLPHMRKAARGHVINLSSTSGLRGLPAAEFYTASKFALEGLADSMRYSLAPFNIAVTNVNPGPVATSFVDKFGNANVGGRGTREPEDPTGYLASLADRNIASLASRIRSDEGQSSEEVARVVVNVAILGQEAKKPSDVPLNIGTNHKTQALIDTVKRHPTGWGGLYSDIMLNMPPLTHTDETALQDEL
eukprot:CAMPEP_0185029196 /NCGR_PEP_ID=MMETSP1103-20130426/15352_1 /TAXON_ID=36769 /ORGANISM="Paraphysomonas bandaiensis, Strain Caron Lab Isolate" /LENGTH=270 /DNA_ID=CAMNT_0027563851 /DNA_START=192 /DNA_END=1004 /DNA_ORIENTATION=+